MDEQAALTRLSVEALVAMRRVTEVITSPQGDHLIVVAQRLDRKEQSRYVHDLWRLPLDGGEAICLTPGDTNDRAPCFTAAGDLAFLSDRAWGDKEESAPPKTQLWCFDRRGGDAKRLTDEPLGVQRFAFAKAADVLVVQTASLPLIPHEDQRKAADKLAKQGPSAILYERMPARYWDHWIPQQHVQLFAYHDDLKTRVALTPLATDEHRQQPWVLSDDGSVVAITARVASGSYEPDGDELKLIDTTSAAQRTISASVRRWHGSLALSPSAKRLAYQRVDLSPERQGGTQLWLYDLEEDTHRRLISHEDLWFNPCAFSDDEQALYGGAELDGQSPLLKIDLQEDSLHRLSDAGFGGVYQLSGLSGATLYGIFQSLTQPPAPFTFSLDTQTTPALHHQLNPAPIDPSAFNISYHRATSSDGLACPYFVVTPADAPGPLPAIIWIHGGPINQWADTWHWRWNSLIGASEGFAMILPNPRGSTGLGQAWVEGIWGNQWGGQCYEDLMAVADEVSARADIDSARMVAMGGSFGGYMTSWIGTQTERFCCLVSHAGVANMRTFHGVTDNPAYWAWMHNVSPYEHPEQWDRYSPIAHIKGWKSPALIIHGQQDYRVPVGESLQLFDALQWAKVKAKLLIYPDENHWILKPHNIISWYAHVFAFIKEHTSA